MVSADTRSNTSFVQLMFDTFKLDEFNILYDLDKAWGFRNSNPDTEGIQICQSYLSTSYIKVL